MKRFALAIVLLAASLAGAASAYAADPQGELSTIASAYAGRPTIVMCATSGADWAASAARAGALVDSEAFAQLEAATIWMRHSECRYLLSMVWGYRDDVQEQGYSLLALTHEATHIALNSSDEARVECAASQNLWRMLMLLPKRGDAKHVALVYGWARWAHQHEPTAYRADC